MWKTTFNDIFKMAIWSDVVWRISSMCVEMCGGVENGSGENGILVKKDERMHSVGGGGKRGTGKLKKQQK